MIVGCGANRGRALSRPGSVDVTLGRESRIAEDPATQTVYYVDHMDGRRRTYGSVERVATALLVRGTGAVGVLLDRGADRTLTESELQRLRTAVGETRTRIRVAAALALHAPAVGASGDGSGDSPPPG